MADDIFILGGARTPMADYTGKLKDFSALELGAIAARAAMERTGVRPEVVNHVVFGNVLQTSADAVYGARHVGLKAGVPIEVPALTVNRLCGSGIQAAISGGQMIRLDEADVVLTGGTESMSQAPHVIRGLRSGLRLGQGQLEDTLWSALLDTHCGCTMAGTAENCAAKYGVSREEQDRYAIRSQQLADAAWKDGRFKDEVVPVEITSRKGVELFARDDHMRPDSTLEGLAKLPAAFSKNGCVTAGNASGIVDGAAALLLASEPGVRTHGLTPLARLTHWATVGVEPALMGMGPVPATRMVLDKAGLALKDIDLDRGQRSVRGAVPVGRERARPRSRPGQRQRRGDCARPPARHDGDAAAADARPGAPPPRAAARARDRVHRRRPGDRGDRRDGVGRFANRPCDGWKSHSCRSKP